MSTELFIYWAHNLKFMWFLISHTTTTTIKKERKSVEKKKGEQQTKKKQNKKKPISVSKAQGKRS